MSPPERVSPVLPAQRIITLLRLLAICAGVGVALATGDELGRYGALVAGVIVVTAAEIILSAARH